jgi:hypothetical protein
MKQTCFWKTLATGSGLDLPAGPRNKIPKSTMENSGLGDRKTTDVKTKGQNNADLLLTSKESSIMNLFFQNKQLIKHSTFMLCNDNDSAFADNDLILN